MRDVSTIPPFTLEPTFIQRFRTRKPPFGFGVLSEIVFLRTYSRLKEDGTNEQWFETVQRVVEGTYSMQKRWILANSLRWDDRKAQRSAQEMYERIFAMKFLPPGRGLWAMGSPLTNERGLSASLLNCAFHSTEGIDQDPVTPFTFLMEASMLGIGCGFDTKGARKLTIQAPADASVPFVVPDTREGWVESLALCLKAYFQGAPLPTFDYSLIRPAGAPIKGFGGTAAGPGILKDLHDAVTLVLEPLIGQPITVRAIVDLMNLIGKCVVSGNLRRTAEIAFGSADSEDFLNLKNYELHPERAEYGWTSNNSVFADLGMDYSALATRIMANGEPGVAWLENMRAYSRMGDQPDWVDKKVAGGNPCVPAGTRVLTREGYRPIETLVGVPVDVWNGTEFSTVTPRVTGYNQPLVRVVLNDGRELTCTPYHEFLLRNGTRCEARHLQPGQSYLLKRRMPVISGGAAVTSAYTQGFFTGDGQQNGTTKGALLYGEKQELLEFLDTDSPAPLLSGDRRWASFPRIEHEKWFVPLDGAIEDRLEWFAGLVDADGTAVSSDNNVQLQLTSVNREFLREVQLMLTTLGVSAKVTQAAEAGLRPMPNGKGGVADYQCQDVWRLLVSSTDVATLCELGFKPNRVELAGNAPQRDARRFTVVDRVDDAGTAPVVYCFNEPLAHAGVFEGILTGQCLEQSLENAECCCLVETFPAKHDTLEDYLRTLKFAYLYAKTVTLGTTPWPETNQVMLRNRRIGLSQSGIVQAIRRLGMNEYLRWCEEGYETVRDYDAIYSDWLAIPRSVKVTSVKPSGSVSLLAGATPGLHYPESRFYIRRVRLSVHSELVAPLREAGYMVEPAFGSEETTVVVEIPVAIEDEVRTASEVSMWEQLALTAFLQRYWSDNQVSSTVTFDATTEGPQIAAALDLYQYQLKGISFLPRVEAGAYPQMPYEAISEERYREIAASVKPLQLHAHEEALAERFCDGDSCLIL